MNIEEEIKERAKKQGIKKIERDYRNLSYAFSKTNCNFIKKELEEGGQVFALKIPGFKGIFTKKKEPFKSFAEGLCEDIKKIDKCGFISTDELPAYGIGEEEIKCAKDMINASEEDVILFVAVKEELAKPALDSIASRIELIIHS